MLKFEYRGLNLMDQISSVHIALDLKGKTIHIKDEAHVVWPDYRGNDLYVHSDGFYQMVRILKQQHLFQPLKDLSEVDWIDEFSFYFYKEHTILLFIGDKFKRKILVNSKNSDDLLIFTDWIS